MFYVIVGKITLQILGPVSRKKRLVPISSSRQATVNWVAEGFSYIQSHSEMIEKSFSVCGITTHNPQKMRKDAVLRSIMQYVNEKIHEEDGLLEECDEDPFYNT